MALVYDLILKGTSNTIYLNESAIITQILQGNIPMSEQSDTPANASDKEIYYDQRSVALRTTQSIYFVKDHDKASLLSLLLEEYKKAQVVIVVKSKKKADTLSAFLNEKKFNAASVHGNHRQEQQQEAANKFNLASLNVIITTDMILKTLALENIKLIISYDLPELPQEYYNRLAYMKEQGEAMALVSPEDEAYLSDIEDNMKKEIDEKVLEGFVATPTPTHTKRPKKDRTKKPRHRKNKARH
jgi:superfamily II DNA/RNA helicase